MPLCQPHIGKYDDGISQNTKDCPNLFTRCQTPTQSLICKGNRIPEDNCICQLGFNENLTENCNMCLTKLCQ